MRTYALVTMVIAGIFIPVNLLLVKKRGPSAAVMACAFGAFIFFQYTLYNNLRHLTPIAIGSLLVLLIVHFFVKMRFPPAGGRK